jgi:thymidylate kinase
VAERHAERLWQLAGTRPAGPLREAIDSPRVADLVLQRCAEGDVSGLLALRAPLTARLPRPPLASRAMRGARTMASPLIKAVHGRGISVAVLGPDGAGKSTLVASLARGLPMPVRTQYLGLYGSGRRPARLGRVPGVTLIGQLASSWRAYAAAGYHRRRGRVVLFDRYAYDALLPSTRGAGGTKRAVRRAIIGRLAPHPDLVLVLDAPAAKIHDRKAELGIEELERRRVGYRRLAEGLDSTTTTALIDAAADASTVRRHATWLVWRELRRRRAYNREPQADDERVTDGDR